MQYSLQVFEIVFTGPVISRMAPIRGWAGRRGWSEVVGVGGKPEADHPCHYSTDSSAAFPADDRNVHKPQVRGS